ncbi:MAG: hypothetical protein PHU25_17095 [Deltaproteobacteria bacterium]|nr:hypothetical protein [Deltaproteobacteria bacterium]
MRVALVILLLTGAGCSQIIGVRDYKIVEDGGVNGDADHLRASIRDFYDPTSFIYYLGLRCAR